MKPYWETLLAFDSLQEVERIDGLLAEYEAVTAAVRPRMEADALNRDMSKVVDRLRYDPDAAPMVFSSSDVVAAVERIMKGTQWRKTEPPVS